MLDFQRTCDFIPYRVTTAALNTLHPCSHPATFLGAIHLQSGSQALDGWRGLWALAPKPSGQNAHHFTCSLAEGRRALLGLRPPTLCDQCPKFGFWSWPHLLLNLYPVNLTGLWGRSHVAVATQQLPGRREEMEFQDGDHRRIQKLLFLPLFHRNESRYAKINRPLFSFF